MESLNNNHDVRRALRLASGLRKRLGEDGDALALLAVMAAALAELELRLFDAALRQGDDFHALTDFLDGLKAAGERMGYLPLTPTKRPAEVEECVMDHIVGAVAESHRTHRALRELLEIFTGLDEDRDELGDSIVRVAATLLSIYEPALGAWARRLAGGNTSAAA